MFLRRMAQDPFSQDAWTRARDRYVEDLSEEEKPMYYQASLEMIFYDASAAQKQHQARSKSLEIVKRLQPLGTAIEQYGQALDVYANAYPLALSPLWGSIRISLHVSDCMTLTGFLLTFSARRRVWQIF